MGVEEAPLGPNHPQRQEAEAEVVVVVHLAFEVKSVCQVEPHVDWQEEENLNSRLY